MFAGYLFHDGFIGHHWKEFWGEAILVLGDHKALENMHHVPFLVMIAPLVVGLVGITVAWYAYIRDPDLPRRAAKQQVVLYQFLLNKWYFDEIYDFIFVRPAMRSEEHTLNSSN